jgi:hypothetical protein
MKRSPNNLLTTVQTDERINAAATPGFGAIEDATENQTTITYFFEHGVAGRVCRCTGAVTISIDPVYE